MKKYLPWLIAVLSITSSIYLLIQLNKAQSLLSSSSDSLHCTECKTATYNDITFEDFAQWVENYRKYDIPALETNNDRSPGNGQETHSVWADVNQLENFLCVLRRKAQETEKNTDSLGVRIYFIKYDPSDGRKGNTVSAENPNKLSVALIPTYCKDGINYDFPQEDLLFGSSEKKLPLLMSFDYPLKDANQRAIPDRFNPCPNFCEGAIFP